MGESIGYCVCVHCNERNLRQARLVEMGNSTTQTNFNGGVFSYHKKIGKAFY